MLSKRTPSSLLSPFVTLVALLGLPGCGSDAADDGGTGTAGFGKPETLASGQQKPSYVAVDSDRAYFAGFDGVPTLRACPKAGGPVEVLWEGSEVATFDLVVDSSGVYGGMSSLWRVDLAGGKPTELAPGVEVDELAVDGTHVYATTDAGVVRAPKTGGAVELLTQATGPRSIAVDHTDVYFGEGPMVMRVPKTGGTAQAVGTAGYTIMHIDLGSAHVYALPMNGQPVVRLPKAGGPAETVHEIPASDVPQDITVFDEDLYYHSVGGIELLANGGGPPVGLAADQEYIFDVAVDASGVYFTVRNDALVARLPRR